MASVNFSLVLHNHQPVGNFDKVFADAYESAYRPFLDVLEKFPAIKIGLHVSGPLLDWIEANRPDYLDRLRNAVNRGQIELLGGGYYEPITTALPERDRIGQIRMMRDYLKEKFAVDVGGYWLAERVWEQSLTKSLVDAGVEYTLCDDAHFFHAGLREDELTGYYCTEDEGRILRIFPISEKLRYTIPFADPERTIEHLATLATDDGRNLLLYGDDGEKFGSWPETHKHVYTNGWLERFFKILSDNTHWIKILKPGEALKRLPPRGRIFLSDCSYREMTGWALPQDAQAEFEELHDKFEREGEKGKAVLRFLKGGFWRNFRVKYPEANQLYGKMMHVSEKVASMPEGAPETENARRELYMGQCNCPYWHGVFGGLYLPHLRYAVYKHLINAEKIADKAAAQKTSLPRLTRTDYDYDGQDEIIVQTGALNCYLKPSQGGQMVELDVVDKCMNLLDTLSRRKEAYHKRLIEAARNKGFTNVEVQSIHHMVKTKESGLERLLFYDRYQRKSLVDHLLPPDLTVERFANGEYDELFDFTNQPYSADIQQRNAAPAVHMRARRADVEIAKSLTFTADSHIIIDYVLLNHSAKVTKLKFGSEFNFSMLAGNAHDRYYFTSATCNAGKLATIAAHGQLTNVGLVDEWTGIAVRLMFDRPTDVWTCPVETVSLSEGGFERIYQSSCICPVWDIEIPAGGKWQARVIQEISPHHPKE
jgi:alpha-amylase